MKAYLIVALTLLITAFVVSDTAADVTMTFEEFLGYDQTPIATFYHGISFESGSGGSDWVARDATSNNYNVSSWPSGQTWNGAWYWMYDFVGATTALNYSGNDGVIRFDDADATYVELGYTVNSTLWLLAYDAGDNLIDQDSGPANLRYNNGNESGPGTLRVDWNGTDYIAYVIIHDQGNFWIVDNITTDASGIILREDCYNEIDDDEDGDVDNDDSDCWVCSDGDIDPGEECDDGNLIDGDGCSSNCELENQPPDCSVAAASLEELWPPNHKYVDIAIMGVTDPDGDPITITITSITQDEEVDVDGVGDGNTSPDGTGVGTDTASVRSERQGTGNGRVYEISFTATDPAGAECTRAVQVCVPHDQSPEHECIDDGQVYDSTEE